MSQTIWPSVEHQLIQSNVVPGSALEKLIRDNQDFHLLRPEEAHDQIGLPMWLRVYWRKQHPELVYSADDPTGGYPRVLKDVHTWMLTHQDLRPGSSPTPQAPEDLAPPEAAGSNLRISGTQTTARSESDIRVNYKHLSTIIAASNNIGGGGQAQFFSSDRGVTWGQTSLPLVLNDVFHSDPTVDWTPLTERRGQPLSAFRAGNDPPDACLQLNRRRCHLDL